MRARRPAGAYYLKAEAVLAWHVMIRHRATRAAVAIALLAAVGVRFARLDPRVVWIAGTGGVAAVAWSRLVARSGAGQSIWYAAAPVVAAYGGRVVGGMALVVAVAAGLGLVVWPAGPGWSAGEMVSVVVHGAASGAASLILTPVVGSSAAAFAGTVAAVLGAWAGVLVNAAPATAMSVLLLVRTARRSGLAVEP